jgi:hypothetical protein
MQAANVKKIMQQVGQKHPLCAKRNTLGANALLTAEYRACLRNRL